MAVNQYFNDLYQATDQDQELYNNLIVESIQVHGRDMQYLPRTLTNFDDFFGEDAVSAFNSAIVIEMQMENTDGWAGNGKFMSKFGFEMREDATLIVARSRFKDEVTSVHPEITIPREGDIIMLPSELDKRNRAFEIMYVSGESVFYQLGELYVWSLTVSSFEYNGESFNTGNDKIDGYQTRNSIATVVNLGAGSGEFIAGELISQGSWAAQVVSHNENTLTVINTSGKLDDEDVIIGSDSMATWSLENVATTTAQDAGSQNTLIKTETESIGLIDYSESDPFGGL